MRVQGKVLTGCDSKTFDTYGNTHLTIQIDEPKC